MIFWKLFLGFLRVGCFSFGGAYSAIPIIRDVVLSYGWMNDEELAHMIAISESTPGPIMVNLATFVGSREAGLAGAAVATLTVILPAFVIILLVVVVLKNVLKNAYVKAALQGLIPCVTGIILATGLYMTVHTMLTSGAAGGIDLRDILLTVFLAALFFGFQPIFKKKLSPIALILIAAVCGIVVYGLT